MVNFQQNKIHSKLLRRRLLCKSVSEFNVSTLGKINNRKSSEWNVSINDNLLFDFSGLQAIAESIRQYQGRATELRFKLALSTEAIRDYYSHSRYLDDDGNIKLPLIANLCQHVKINKAAQVETLTVKLPEIRTPIDYPVSLMPAAINSTPLALLMPYTCDHDLLFANQIALFSMLEKTVKKAAKAWIKTVFSRTPTAFRKRLPLKWNRIHPSANIHKTAVIEGSVIGPGCQIGALSVIRFSMLGSNVQLRDGAKIEFSIVDDNTWLMHDLVLVSSVTEQEVFLINGPYQFSIFQQASAAFATIMMDYRPDGKSHRINTPAGVKDYQGRLLGALLEENAKVLGGTLLAPSVTVPQDTHIAPEIDNIVTAKKLIKANVKADKSAR